MQIKGSTFLVTGGGFGPRRGDRAPSRRGRRRMSPSRISSRTPARGSPREIGARASFAAADVTDEAQVSSAIAAARKAFGALHGAINCAGIAPGERVLGRSGPHRLDTFRRAVEINLVGTFNVLRLAAQAMAENPPDAEGERGIIINTASIAAFDGQIGQAAYSASKAGVAGLTLPAARELARLGIRVMTIAPGHLRDAHDGGHERGSARFARRRRCRFRRGSAGRRSSRRWSSTSSGTRC